MIDILRMECFNSYALSQYTFENDNGKSSCMEKIKAYVENWDKMYSNNIGLLLWGSVGTGKTYAAACIANALLDKGVNVRMTDFAEIFSSLFDNKKEYIKRLLSYHLLIIDDFGMERGTEYSLEQIYNVINARYQSRRPLIITTNLSLTELKNPVDTAHRRIYDRVLELCVPIRFEGESMRKEIAQNKLRLAEQILRKED